MFQTVCMAVTACKYLAAADLHIRTRLCGAPRLRGPWPAVVTFSAPRRQNRHKGSTLWTELSPEQNSTSSFCISLLQQSPLPYSPKPSDHSHLALTQSLSIYAAQREERVNVGVCAKAESRSVSADSLPRPVLFLTTRACVVSTEVNYYVSGVWRKATSC